MIESTLNIIKEQLGLELVLCDYFDGIRTNSEGEKYFNIELNQRTSESSEYTKLLRFANDYNIIRVEPNGLKRVAIFYN